MNSTDTLIIGASVSGLASAACLHQNGLAYQIIEKQLQVATPWRNHYERLHLHTNKRLSNLPYFRFGKEIPAYPSRLQVIEYLEKYQEHFNIHPLFETEALAIRKVGTEWITDTNKDRFSSRYLIMATGAYFKPRQFKFPGQDSFPGTIVHSAYYKNGGGFSGKRVLVVGFGNSACEIAIDLVENGASVSMAVRSPVNVIPRDVLGIPVLELSLLLSKLSPKVADRLSAPLMKVLVGDITKLGLQKKSYGPLEQICRDHAAPLLDIGTLRLIREGKISVYGNIESIDGKQIHFEGGKCNDFDAIIAAVGYDRNCADFLEVAPERIEDLQRKIDQQQYFGKDGLYFCGYWISPTGQIREISLDARKIAGHITASIHRKEQ